MHKCPDSLTPVNPFSHPFYFSFPIGQECNATGKINHNYYDQWVNAARISNTSSNFFHIHINIYTYTHSHSFLTWQLTPFLTPKMGKRDSTNQCTSIITRRKGETYWSKATKEKNFKNELTSHYDRKLYSKKSQQSHQRFKPAEHGGGVGREERWKFYLKASRYNKSVFIFMCLKC